MTLASLRSASRGTRRAADALTLKLFAAVDQWPASVHLQDLRKLSPTDDELERANAWVVRQDAAPEFPTMVDEVIDDVRRHR